MITNAQLDSRIPIRERIKDLRIALLIPCLNEELTVAKVIRDFRKEIPDIDVYVFDNDSTDRTAEIAMEEGVYLIRVPTRGKGFVVRRMCEMVEADFYIMVDGDDTYDSTGIWKLLEPVVEQRADMTVATRLTDHSTSAFRKFHQFGNRLIQTLINTIFRSDLEDICSGYRVMSRYFIKNIPFTRHGFEIETEFTVYSLIFGFKIKELKLPYRQRPPNSHSKLSTFRDGYRVLMAIMWLARDLRPLVFFGGISVFLYFGISLPLQFSYPELTQVHLLLPILSISLLTCGLILNSLSVKVQELHFLNRRNGQSPIALVPKPNSPFKGLPKTATDSAATISAA